MKEFLEWKLGDRQLPAKCVMITIDDGWKSVYTDAYPILKETGFPFTIFPYTKFITGRGSAMSPAQIQEMLNNGATLGSHACFYSDATVLTSSCCKMENMDHALSQLPYSLCAAGLSAAGYLVCGLLM